MKSFVWYSPKMFSDNGWTVPETWDDMLKLSDTIAATGIKLVPQLRKHPLGFATCLGFMALVFCAIALFKIPLGWVLLVLGGVACVWTWKKIPA